MSLPVRGAWIEIHRPCRSGLRCPSLPVRGAWIEIQIGQLLTNLLLVAPRKGSVD